MIAKLKEYIGIIIFAVGIACSFLYGKHVEGLEHAKVLESQRSDMQAKINAERERREEVSARFENKLDNLKIVNTTINRTVEKEIEKQIYTDCKFPESGSNLINENADRLNAARRGNIK